MESQLKYLDELIHAIKQTRQVSRASEFNSLSFPNGDAIISPECNNDKSFKIITTLLRNLNKDFSVSAPAKDGIGQNNRDIVIVKSLHALNLLIESKPFLLDSKMVMHDSQVTLGNSPLMELLVVEMFGLSIRNYRSPHKLWLISKYLNNWCSLYTVLFKKNQLQVVVTDILADIEKELAKVLRANLDVLSFTNSLKKSYVLMYWMCLRTSPPTSTSNFIFHGTSRWGNYFQKLIRLLWFIMTALRMCNDDILDLKSRLFSLLFNFLAIHTKPGILDTPTLTSTDNLKFVLSSMVQYIENPDNFRKENPSSLTAKTILRIYSLVLSENSVNSQLTIFIDFFPFYKYFDNWDGDVDLLVRLDYLDGLTKRALLIICFDLKRRLAPRNELVYLSTERVWSALSENDPLTKEIIKPFAECYKQLENLRILILFKFKKYAQKNSLLSRNLNNLVPGIITRYNNNLDKLSKEIATIIQGSLVANNVLKIVSLIDCIGKLACYEATRGSDTSKFDGWHVCHICDSKGQENVLKKIKLDRPEADKSSKSYKLLITHLIKHPKFKDFSESIIISAILCLQRIFTHFQPPLILTEDGKYNVLFEKFNECFTARNRYVRIMACRLIPLWNLTDFNNVNDRQIVALIKYLQTLNKTTTQETTILAWSQLTLTTNEDVFDTLLLKLIDIFNSTDYAQYIMVTFQIQNLAMVSKKTPYQLLSPIIPVLLRSLGKNLIGKKVSFRRLAKLLGYSSKTILDIYQRYLVPYAVIQYKNDIFTEISKIMCDLDANLLDKQRKELLERNSRQIFAVALVKHGFFSLDILENLFLNKLPSFDRNYITAYLPDYKTLSEICKLYKNSETIDQSDIDNENMVLCSLRFLITNFDRDKHQGAKYKNFEEWSPEQEMLFQTHLQENILGIFQVFSSDIHDVEGRTTYYEKLRVVNGISFLIKHAAKKSISFALAQISICLQTGLEIAEVRYSSLRCWHILVKKLEDTELSTILESLVAFILQNWKMFSNKVQDMINKILETILTDKLELISKVKPYVGLALAGKLDLETIQKFPNFARIIHKMRKSTDLIPIFAKNLQSNNKYVICQNLDDIEVFLNRKLESNAGTIQLPHYYTEMSNLLGALLDTSQKFKNIDQLICQRSAKYISMIGILDMTKIQYKNKSNLNDEVYDFSNHSQTVKFLLWVINDILVPAFWHSENPSKQLFVALVIQESLRYCGLSSEFWDIEKKDEYYEQMKLWDKFDMITKTTVYPLLSSLYQAQSWKEYVPLTYPSNKFKEGCLTWIKTLILDLLKTGTIETHPLHVFSSLIREDDGYLSEFLLPYVVMDIIIKSNDKAYSKIMDNIIEEFRSVFAYEIKNLNHLQLDSLKMCYESIFRVMEYCKKWITKFKQNYHAKNGTYIVREIKYLEMLARIERFLDCIPSEILAQRSLETNSFERSALYLEQCYRNERGFEMDNIQLLNNLQKTYEEIGDIDSIDGILKSYSSGNLLSKIEELQYSESWKVAQNCYDVLGEVSGENIQRTKMLKSMYDHQLYPKILDKLSGIMPNISEAFDSHIAEWYSMGLESASLVGNLKELGRWVERIESMKDVTDPQVLLFYNISKALCLINANKLTDARCHIEKSYRLIGVHFTSLSTATTLLKKRHLMMKLHSIYDILLLSFADDEYKYDSKVKILNTRMQRIGDEFEPNHYLLCMRRSYDSVNNNSYIKEDLKSTYFKLAQVARKNSRLDLSSDYLMSCLQSNHPQAELEFAELLWKQGENERAIKLVKEIYERNKKIRTLKSCDKAAVLLKYTEWLDMSNNSSSEQIIKQYQQVFKLDPACVEAYYSMGQYYSTLLERKNAEGYVTDGRLEYNSISYFLLAFEKNTIKARENLPKVVTFWLDIASHSVAETKKSRSQMLARAADDICAQIEESLKKCPTYIWYTVITQLISRLMHPHSQSAKIIMHILLNLCIEFPEHMLWYISSLLSSNSSSRVDKAKRIIEKFITLSPGQQELVNSSVNLVTAFINICLTEVKTAATRTGRSLDADFRFNIGLAPSDLVVPVRNNLDMLSPLNSASVQTFKPFRTTVGIAKFGSRYKVFSSLKKPKKIDIIGTDGKLYGIMCKKEDVRQDNQYMQFATTMDVLLNNDVASRERDLGITTYSVLSLREDCGLLEIVPNVITLRSIFSTMYESLKISYNMKQLYDKWSPLSPGGKKQFYSEILTKFPPVLYQWFLETFPDPIQWFTARNVYSRSYAVMAMVGHILGLGDRHCENILLDIETGKVLHVDFDCLFEKGRKLPIPEIVPFRLTRNLQDALGIVGTEGTFKKSCQVTLKLMRDNEVALVNIIETIMYDRNMDDSIQKAMKVLRNKIRGIDPRDGLLLSVPGQVETLIQEATSVDNLSQMYIGWLPFW